MHLVEICWNCCVTSRIFSVSTHIRRYWPVLYKLSARFDFGTKTENLTFSLKNTSESRNNVNKLRPCLKQAIDWGKPYFGVAKSKNFMSNTVFTYIYSIFMCGSISGRGMKLKNPKCYLTVLANFYTMQKPVFFSMSWAARMASPI